MPGENPMLLRASIEPIRVMVVLGTRPEAVKLFPVMMALRADSRFQASLVTTGQHRELVQHVLNPLGLPPDLDLQLMRPGQSLTEVAAGVLTGMSGTYNRLEPELVIVQGDTTSAVCAGLAAFYHLPRIPLAHVEAGLRSSDRLCPYPEEVNRRLIAGLADLHFAPTRSAKDALAREGVAADRIFLTGNTVVDAVQFVTMQPYEHHVDIVSRERHHVLITLHRRELWGTRSQQRVLLDVLRVIASLAAAYPTIQFVYRDHPNPVITELAHGVLEGIANVRFIEPIPSYRAFMAFLQQMSLVVTDSGGLQEEAPLLGIPVVVVRETTERPEALGAESMVAGIAPDLVREALEPRLRLLNRTAPVAADRRPPQPSRIGDGHAAVRIRDAVLHFLRGVGERPVDLADTAGDE